MSADEHNGYPGKCWKVEGFNRFDTAGARGTFRAIVRRIRDCPCTVCNGALDEYLKSKEGKPAAT